MEKLCIKFYLLGCPTLDYYEIITPLIQTNFEEKINVIVFFLVTI